MQFLVTFYFVIVFEVSKFYILSGKVSALISNRGHILKRQEACLRNELRLTFSNLRFYFIISLPQGVLDTKLRINI